MAGLLLGSVVLSGIPAPALAGTPDYDPVFYYYHTDSLGSAHIMTDRDGDVVQHYGYQPFGQERFQADSTVPDPEFSQAYNRYAYVCNNPLNFTDPTGQNPLAVVLFTIGTTKVTVGSVLVAAAVNAGITAAMGGNPLQGFAFGLMGGLAAGAFTGVMTGGDPLMGAVTAGISAGVMAAFCEIPLPSSVSNIGGEYLENLVLSTAAGSLAGGVTSEIFGGSFTEGAASGAAGAAVSSALIKFCEPDSIGAIEGPVIPIEMGKGVVEDGAAIILDKAKVIGFQQLDKVLSRTPGSKSVEEVYNLYCEVQEAVGLGRETMKAIKEE